MTVKQLIEIVKAESYAVHSNDCHYGNEHMHNFVKYLDEEVEYASTDSKGGLQIYVKMD